MWRRNKGSLTVPTSQKQMTAGRCLVTIEVTVSCNIFMFLRVEASVWWRVLPIYVGKGQRNRCCLRRVLCRASARCALCGSTCAMSVCHVSRRSALQDLGATRSNRQRPDPTDTLALSYVKCNAVQATSIRKHDCMCFRKSYMLTAMCNYGRVYTN